MEELNKDPSIGQTLTFRKSAAYDNNLKVVIQSAQAFGSFNYNEKENKFELQGSSYNVLSAQETSLGHVDIKLQYNITDGLNVVFSNMSSDTNFPNMFDYSYTATENTIHLRIRQINGEYEYENSNFTFVAFALS